MNEWLCSHEVRGADHPFYASGTKRPAHLNHRAELLVAHGLPLYSELVSRGQSYWCRTSTAAAPVTAVPTTACLISIWNGDPSKTYLVDSVFLIQVAVTAAIQNVGLLGNVSIDSVRTAPAGGLTPRSLYGSVPYQGKAVVTAGDTISAATGGVADNWQPLGTTGPAQNTLQVGTIVDVELYGKILLPPMSRFALSALAGAATATSIQLGLRWHEALIKQPD